MKSIHLLTIGAALAAVLQLAANDIVQKPGVSAAEAASAVRQQQSQQRRSLVSLTGPWRLQVVKATRLPRRRGAAFTPL